MRNRYSLGIAAGIAIGILACGGEGADEGDTARDLSLASADSVADLADEPMAEPDQPAAQPTPARRTPPKADRSTTPTRPVQPERQPDPEPPTVTLLASEGTAIMLMAGDTLTSRHNQKGEQIVATNVAAVLDAEGRVVIPPAAVFLGTISDIAPAENPGGEGRLVLTFNRVEFGGNTFEIQARTDSVGAFMKGRGVTAGDAAKVGAGAVVGAIAGRIIGGNRTGTAVGAVAGAAAGAGIAAATRDIDIILPEGAPIRLILTAPFTIELAEGG